MPTGKVGLREGGTAASASARGRSRRRAASSWVHCRLPRPGACAPSGTTDKRAREAARLAIPWKALPSNVRPTVSEVVGGATLYRQMPTRVIDCDADLYTYLIDRPELVVGAWNVMGVSRLKLERVAPDRFNVTDAAGAVGEVRVVHRSGGGVDARGKRQPLTMVLLASGVYQAPPMPQPIRGKSVLLLRADAVDEANGRSYVTTRLDSFMRFGGPATRVAAKTLSPLIGRTADHNFVETMRFVSLFSRTAETNPAGMAASPATCGTSTSRRVASSPRCASRRRTGTRCVARAATAWR